MVYLFNVTWPWIIQSNDNNLNWCYIKPIITSSYTISLTFHLINFVSLLGFNVTFTVYRHRTWHPNPSQYTDTGLDTQTHHSIQTQDLTLKPITVYRHRTWHPNPSQYTDTGPDTQTHHSIQTQDLTLKPITVYRHRTWHPNPSQYTDTGLDTQTHHSIQTQDLTLKPITVYRRRTWHSNPSQYTDTGLDTQTHHTIQTQGWPVVVLSIDVERHTVIHNYPFLCLRWDTIWKSFPDLLDTWVNAQLLWCCYSGSQSEAR